MAGPWRSVRIGPRTSSPDERQEQRYGILTIPGDGAMVTIRRRPK